VSAALPQTQKLKRHCAQVVAAGGATRASSSRVVAAADSPEGAPGGAQAAADATLCRPDPAPFTFRLRSHRWAA
jgi:hypothetical protein